MSWIDEKESWEIIRHEKLATGRVESFVEDEVRTPSGETITRQYATHPGAVAVIALDEQGRLAVVHQYRHPVRMRLVEPPAGLLDVEGEDYLLAAQRELAEEAKLAADDWRILVDTVTSPGGLAETIRVYLARSLRPAPRPDGFILEGEEVDMGLSWVPLEELVDLIYAGKIQSPTMVSGTLALALAIEHDRLDALRDARSPWHARE